VFQPDFVLLRHDRGVDGIARAADKFDVTALWLASTKPAASSRRLISRNDSGLSRIYLNLDSAHLGRA
jgi:hypothetical protein